MEEVYSGFAQVYDAFMDNVPYEEWAKLLVTTLKEYDITPQRVQTELSGGSLTDKEDSEGTENLEQNLETEDQEQNLELNLAQDQGCILDMGCGTGTLSQMLYDAGYDVIGIDNSEEMLEIAMEKREESGREILYLLQDMREFELYGTVGAVISVCDSLNYLLEEEDLVDTFKLVNNYLYPEGVFLFDFNTVYKYETVIGDTTIAENREDCSFIWDNYYHEEEQINEYDLTIFVEEQEGLFRRFEETHYQRGYTLEQMKDYLQQAGLIFMSAVDSDTGGPVTDTTERIFVCAKEHGKNE